MRWTVASAWTAFEMACLEATGAPELGIRFKDRLSEAIDHIGGKRPDWSQGLWQRVLTLYGNRKDYVHGGIPQERLFAEVVEAETAITVAREAVKAVFALAGKGAPDWVDDDANPEAPRGAHAFGTVTRAGVDPLDPNRVRVAFWFDGRERECEVMPPGSDPIPVMEGVLKETLVPLSRICAYRGDDLIEDWVVRMRGSPIS